MRPDRFFGPDPQQKKIAVGLYDPATGKRFPVVTSAGTTEQDRLFLPAKVTISE